ncbi:MAG: 30S ribosomal protein S6 [bacterium]
MTQYETIIVLDSFLKEEDKTNLLTKFQTFIKNNGGEIHQVDEWGKKRLAYEINRKQYGIYIYIVFSGPNTLPHLLEHEFRLEESILRHLTIKFDHKLAKWQAMKAQAEKEKEKEIEKEKEQEKMTSAPETISEAKPETISKAKNEESEETVKEAEKETATETNQVAAEGEFATKE